MLRTLYDSCFLLNKFMHNTCVHTVVNAGDIQLTFFSPQFELHYVMRIENIKRRWYFQERTTKTVSKMSMYLYCDHPLAVSHKSMPLPFKFRRFAISLKHYGKLWFPIVFWNVCVDVDSFSFISFFFSLSFILLHSIFPYLIVILSMQRTLEIKSILSSLQFNHNHIITYLGFKFCLWQK